MIEVKTDVKAERRMRDMARRYPKETVRAFYGVATKYRNKLKSLIVAGGGKYGVSAWAPKAELTALLTGDRPLGGMLRYANAIFYSRQGRSVVFGWHDRLSTFAEAIQTAENRPYTNEEKSRIGSRLWTRYKMSLRGDTARAAMGAGYSRPARNTINPFVISQTPHIMAEIMKRTERNIAKTLSKA